VPRSATKPSPPKLSEVARHVVAPKGVVATGWPAVEAKCAELGVGFRPWQPPVGRLILSKRPDGKYAATIGGTGMSIPRQVGKTFLVGAIVFALCLLLPNLTVIWTAHRLRTAEETFGKMQAFAKRKRIAPHIRKVVLGSGDEAVLFRNGSRILFGARERGFGRGFDEVDVLIFDEAQILTDNALDDMIPATNQSRQPTGALLLFMGTPPKPTDPGEVFGRMRAEALSGEDDDTGWVEFGADPGYKPPPLPAPLTEADWRQVSKANPSFPQDTPREAILRMRKKLGADSYLREGLGIWSEVDQEDGSFAYWSSLADPSAERGSPVAFGVATAPDGSWSAVAVAWSRPDGLPQVMLADYRPGSAWLDERVKELREKWRGAAAVDSASRGLVSDAEAPSQQVQAQAQNALAAAVEGRRLRWGATEALGDKSAALTVAVRGARWKPMGDTRVLDRKGNTDISPLVAAALALHGLTTAPTTGGWMVSLP
jgi:hypothetical protein